MSRIPVAVLGATGVVGQRFVRRRSDTVEAPAGKPLSRACLVTRDPPRTRFDPPDIPWFGMAGGPFLHLVSARTCY